MAAGSGLINGAGAIDGRLHRFHQPLEIVDFASGKDAGIDVDEIGAGTGLVPGDLSDGGSVPGLDGRGDGLAAGVDQFSDDQHGDALLERRSKLRGAGDQSAPTSTNFAVSKTRSKAPQRFSSPQSLPTSILYNFSHFSHSSL
jgi:hypothetical protein